MDGRWLVPLVVLGAGTLGWSLVLGRPDRNDRTMYTIEPKSVNHEGSSLALDLRRGQDDEWEVAFTVARKPPGHPIDATSFKIRLIDSAGSPLPQLGDWESTLVEVGGSMSTTVNGRVRFRDTGSRLAEVRVEWEGEPLHFRLMPD